MARRMTRPPWGRLNARRFDQAPLQMPQDLREQAEVYAEIHHINLTEAHRYLIKAGGGGGARDAGERDPGSRTVHAR